MRNREYTERALEAVRHRPDLLEDGRELWRIATNGETKQPNH